MMTRWSYLSESDPASGLKINLFKTGGGEVAARELQVPFLGKIPLDPAIVETGDTGKPFVHEESPASDAFMGIVEKIMQTRG
ncbi:MAG: P-loop NTPase [Thermoplasmatota archaeon]